MKINNNYNVVMCNLQRCKVLHCSSNEDHVTDKLNQETRQIKAIKEVKT